MTSSTIDNIEDTTIMRQLRLLAKRVNELDPEAIKKLRTDMDNMIFYVGKDVDLVPNYPFN